MGIVRLFSFFFLMVLLSTAAAVRTECAEHPGLVKIESIYTDTVNSVERRMVGAGILVQYDERYFILSAAHVTQTYYISVNDQRIWPIGRYADLARGIEWIEITKPIHIEQAFAKYYPNCACLIAEDYHWGEIKRESDKLGARYLPVAQGRIAVVPEWLRDIRQSPNKYIPNMNQDSYLANQLQPLKEAADGRLISRSKLAGAISGAPLLGLGLTAPVEVMGIALGSDPVLTRSYFASKELLVSTLQHYLSGKRGVKNGRIAFKNGNAYYDNDFGVHEILPNSVVVAPTKNTGRLPASYIVETPPKMDVDLKAGLYHEGKETLGFVLGNGRLLYANRAALEVGTKLLKGFKKSIHPGDMLISYFLNFNSGDLERFKFRHETQVLKAYEYPAQAAGIRAPASVSANLTEAATVEVLPFGRMRIKVPFVYPDQETLSIILDSYGRYVDPNTGVSDADFRPMLNVRGPQSQKNYSVDLRNLFFIDATNLTQRELVDRIYNGYPRIAITREGLADPITLEFRYVEMRKQSENKGMRRPPKPIVTPEY